MKCFLLRFSFFTFLFLFATRLFAFDPSKASYNFSSSEKPAKFSNRSQFCFSENLGQVSDQNNNPRADVLFSGSSGQLNFYLKKNGISYQQSKIDEWTEEYDKRTNIKTKLPKNTKVHRIDINWLNCNNTITIEKLNALPGYCNYYTGVCPNGVTGVKPYGELIYKNIYNGIDLKWYQKEGNLKYDYYVAAGADYTQIQLEFAGQKSIELSTTGELIITTALGKIIEQAPLVTQNGKRLRSQWQINKNVVSFKIINYDPALPMIIDPIVRVWGTYYGGTGNDSSQDCATDNGTSVYFTGYTTSNSNIATSGSHQNVLSGTNAFLSKFDSTGVRQWATYYGSGFTLGYSVATDVFGNVFMSGSTDGAALIASAGAHQTTAGGGDDAFLVKFNAAGIRQWGTLYGGPLADNGKGCATDLLGNVYLSGRTDSNSGISTPGSQQSVFGGNTDAFLVKFNSAGVRSWGTYYGAQDLDYGFGCCTDGHNNVYLTGVSDWTVSGGVIATPGSHQTVNGGTSALEDAFLVKFNTYGTRLWGTYYGGNFNDLGSDLICDDLLNVYLTGRTESTNGTSIATTGAHQTGNNGGLHDAFLAKFDSTGVRQWGTYYGGANDEVALGSSIHASGNIYITGYTSSPASNTVVASPNGPQSAYGGGAMDGFIAQFTPAGVRKWGSFYGPNLDDYLYGCAADKFYNVYAVGVTSSNFGYGIASFVSHQNAYGGGPADGFLVRFFDCEVPLAPVSTMSQGVNGCVGSTTTLTASGSGTLSWYATPTSPSSIATGTNYVTPVLAAGVYTYYVEAKTCTISANRTPITVTINAVPTLSVNSITASSVICAGYAATVQASGANTYTWSTGANSNIAVFYPTVTTTYTVTGTNAAGCNGSNTISISVYTSPPASLTASSYTSCLTIFGGAPIPLSGNPSGGTYSGSNVSGNSFNPTAVGTFTPMYTYTDSTTNCISTASINITVASCLGISENKNNSSLKLSITPNPNNGLCKINSDTDLDLNIIDQLGRIITTVSLNESNGREAMLHNLASGVYFIMNKNSDQKINRKIVVIK